MSDATDMPGRIVCERDGAVAHLIIDNASRHNSLDLAMWRQASELLVALSKDDGIRALVVSGRGGKSFAAGADISKFDKQRSTPAEVDRYQQISGAVYDGLVRFPKPTIASIGGYCIGGGLAIATSCDIRICGEEAQFALPAAKLGLGYAPDSFAALIDIVGAATAADIIYSARRFGAREAYDMRFVNHVIATNERTSFVKEYAETISRNAPLTIALAKATKLAAAENLRLRAGEHLNGMVDACYASEDYKEGRRAFSEKRSPVFLGR